MEPTSWLEEMYLHETQGISQKRAAHLVRPDLIVSSSWAFVELCGLLLSLPGFSLLVSSAQYFELMGC